MAQIGKTAMGAGWVGETAARPETATRSFAEIVPPSGELYANPAASQARGTVAAGDGGGAATLRQSPSVSASRCHLPIAARQGGLM